MFDFINVPFAWLLLTLYNLVNSYGLALILFALITKILLLYFQAKGKKGMMQTQRLQPKLLELQKQYKDDKQKYQQAMAKLYQDEEVSPMSGCLWSLLPMPVLFALFSVIREPLKNLMKLTPDQVEIVGTTINNLLTSGGQEIINLKDPYAQLLLAQEVHNYFPQVQSALGGNAPGLIDIDFMFLGMNLAQIPQWPWQGISLLLLIPIMSGLSAYAMMWLSQKMSKGPAPAGSMKMMLYMMPLVSVYFGFIMPAGLGVYWTASNLLGLVQEYFLNKHFGKILDAEDARKEELAARRKAAEDEQKRIEREERALRLEEKYKNKKKPKAYRMQNQPKKKPAPKAEEETDGKED